MGHWYKLENGEPLYQVPRSKGGGTRDTTLADARKLNLVPSVTTILAMLDKPMLTRWKLDQLFEAIVFTCPPSKFMDLDKIPEYKKEVFSLSEKRGRDAAIRGDEIHNALEHYYKGNGLELNVGDYCVPVIELLEKEFGQVEWTAEASFSHPLGFGGKCDLHLKPCEKYPNGVVLDFKTKSTEDFSKVKAYPEHCQQLVAYRGGFKISRAECYNLFIGTKEPGLLKLHKWTEEECQKSWKVFQHLVEVWKLLNNFDLNIDK